MNRKSVMKKIELPQLPYAMDALQPFISKQTIEFHYGKHHQTYVDNLNKLVEGTEFENSSLEEMIRRSSGGIFNNAAQVWNHTFYWESLTPASAGVPQGVLAAEIDRQFGSFEDFRQKFTQAALTLFGSGWVWLAKDDKGTLEILQTSNADNPLRTGRIPLLTCDVWEHAYYLDKQNRRAAYVEDFWKIVDWNRVSLRMEGGR